MRTDRLIAELAASPRMSGSARVRISAALAAGWLVSLAGLMLFLGPPLQEMHHTGIASLAVKLGYTIAMAILSVMAAIAAGQPGRRWTRPAALIAIPIVVLTLVALLELETAAAAARREMMFGTAYVDCVKSVVMASLPVFVALAWGYRALAPTRLPAAGFLIGLGAGAAGAVGFTLYCHESSAAFLFTAYTPAMLITALIGAVGARPMLKW